MFLDNSRYARVTQSLVRTGAGREVALVRLRRLPATNGEAYTVQGNDRLDVLAQRRYADPTKFWHIGDANTELYVPVLLARVLRIIRVPGQ
jgi:hypothetical protein